MDTLKMDSRPSSLNILRKFYLRATRLDEYIKGQVSDSRYARLLSAAEELEAMKKLIQTAYVCLNPKLQIIDDDDDDDDFGDRSVLSIGDHATQTEVVHRVLTILLTRRANNVLSQGYQKAERGPPDQANSLLGPGFVNVYPNHRVAEIKSAAWVALFKCLGEEHMINLLLNTSIFIGLKNDYFVQLTGTSLADITPLPLTSYPMTMSALSNSTNTTTLKRKRNTKSHRGGKKRKVTHPDDKPTFPQTPNAIIFARSRMFYARPARSLRGNVVFGLRKEHVLNRYLNTKDISQAKHILKYIFPRQFGLHSVFTHPTDRRETTHAFKDYTDREGEITGARKDRDEKVYRRLGAKVLPLIRKMQKLHQECSYHSLVHYYCSPTLDDSCKDGSEMSLESEKETSKLLTQKEVSTIMSGTLTSGSQQTSQDENIIRHHTPHHKVTAFVCAVIKTVIPMDLFGSEHNRSVIFKGIKELVVIRRFENISLHSVMKGIRITDVPWLAPTNTLSTSKVSRSDFNKRTELFSEFLYWLFDSIIIHLIRTNFYVTETAVHRNRVFYFRHDIWRQISAPSITKLKHTMLDPISKDEAKLILSNATRKSMGYSFVRFLPKESGVRCITNLRRRAYKLESNMARGSRQQKFLGPSINSILQPVFSILNLEKTRDPSRIGNALFSPADMYTKLKDYQSMRVQKGWSFRPLYFARVDIRSCFDTIDQDRLLNIIHRIVKSPEYILHRYCELNMDQGKVRKRFNVRASAADDLAFANNFGEDKAKTTFHRILVEQILPTFMEKDDALLLLEEHVTNNILKMGKQFYRQKVGIPQGSVVSTILCNIFYADLEKKKLPFLTDSDGLLLRLIDDFMFITMNQDHAKTFLQYMHNGFPEYGCSVNMTKSLANFDLTIDAQRVPRLQGSRYFPFCGNMIDTTTLDVVKDFTRMEGANTIDTITVERTQAPGKALVVKTLNALKLGGHAMYIDTSANSLLTALANVYTNFTSTAMKMHNYIRAMDPRPPEAFIQDLIEQVISLQYTLTRSHLKAWPGSTCAVTEQQVRWLGAKAFWATLSTKQTAYKTTLKWLKDILDTTKCGKLQRSMERISSRYSINRKIKY